MDVYKVGRTNKEFIDEQVPEDTFVSMYAKGIWQQHYRKNVHLYSKQPFFVFLREADAVNFAKYSVTFYSSVWRCETEGGVQTAPPRLETTNSDMWEIFWNLWEHREEDNEKWKWYQHFRLHDRPPEGSYLCFDITPLEKLYDDVRTAPFNLDMRHDSDF